MNERARAWLAQSALIALTLGLVVRFALGNAYNLYDDSYIYFTYAENFFRGCGLDFRCDRSTPVEGFTSPLYMLCLLCLRVLTTDLETAATVFGVLAMASAIWLAADALRTTSSWGAALAIVLALGCDDFALINAVSGLETALFALVATGAFRASLRADARALEVWLSLAAWVRPEGMLLWALGLPHWRVIWRGPVAALIALLTLRLVYYRDWLPNTYYAKSGGSSVHLKLGLHYIVETLREYGLVVLAPLALWSRQKAVRALLLSAIVLLGSFLRSGGDVFGYGRLFVPFVPALYVCAALGLQRSLQRPLLASLPLLLWAAFVFKAHSLAPTHGFANVLRWRTLGLYLAREQVGARIATVPIGAISYFSGLPVLDLVGLTEREIGKSGNSVPPERLKQNWLGHERHQTDWVLSQHPDLIVFGTMFSKQPVEDVQRMRAGFYAEWLLLQLAKQHRIPYRPYSPEIVPGTYWHMLISDDWRARREKR